MNDVSLGTPPAEPHRGFARSGAKLNHGLYEAVVDVSVLPKVVEARKEVLLKYSPDILGLNQPQWNSSVSYNCSKWRRELSDTVLVNLLAPQHIDQQDFRKLSQPINIEDKTRYHAFDRGEATTGWNLSTTVSPHTCMSALNTFDSKHKAGKSVKLQSYLSPLERQEQFASRMQLERQQQRAAAKQVAAGAGWQHMPAMRRAKPRPPRPDDIAAVLQLGANESEDWLAGQFSDGDMNRGLSSTG